MSFRRRIESHSVKAKIAFKSAEDSHQTASSFCIGMGHPVEEGNLLMVRRKTERSQVDILGYSFNVVICDIARRVES